MASRAAVREKFTAEELPRFLGYFAAKIEAAGGAFVAGPAPTIADATLLPELRKFSAGFIDHVPTSCLDAFPLITSYIARCLEVPPVKAYYAALAK